MRWCLVRPGITDGWEKTSKNPHRVFVFREDMMDDTGLTVVRSKLGFWRVYYDESGSGPYTKPLFRPSPTLRGALTLIALSDVSKLT